MYKEGHRFNSCWENLGFLFQSMPACVNVTIIYFIIFTGLKTSHIHNLLGETVVSFAPRYLTLSRNALPPPATAD